MVSRRRLYSSADIQAACAWCGTVTRCKLTETLVSTYPACPFCRDQLKRKRVTERTEPPK